MLVCDNTLPTPVLQQPLALGADVVVHATTKALSGNHDAMGGAIVTARDGRVLGSAFACSRSVCGAIPSPFASWLTLRGFSSLVQRVRWQNASALAIARFLAGAPGGSRGAPSGTSRRIPATTLAARQIVRHRRPVLVPRERRRRRSARASPRACGSSAARRASAAPTASSSTAPRSKARTRTRPTICCASRSGSKIRADLIADLDQALAHG